MLSGRNAETIQLGASTISLITSCDSTRFVSLTGSSYAPGRGAAQGASLWPSRFPGTGRLAVGIVG